MQDLIVGMIALAGYKAMNESMAYSDPNRRSLPRNVQNAAWKVFNSWWCSFTREEIVARDLY